MPNNFHVDIISQDTSRIYMRLRGEFDGSSAYQLVRKLNDQQKNIKKITLDTSALKTINSFGLDLFLSNIKRLQNQGVDIVFIGKSKLAFEGGDLAN